VSVAIELVGKLEARATYYVGATVSVAIGLVGKLEARATFCGHEPPLHRNFGEPGREQPEQPPFHLLIIQFHQGDAALG
jgi:hypothetical protein